MRVVCGMRSVGVLLWGDGASLAGQGGPGMGTCLDGVLVWPSNTEGVSGRLHGCKRVAGEGEEGVGEGHTCRAMASSK